MGIVKAALAIFTGGTLSKVKIVGIIIMVLIGGYLLYTAGSFIYDKLPFTVTKADLKEQIVEQKKAIDLFEFTNVNLMSELDSCNAQLKLSVDMVTDYCDGVSEVDSGILDIDRLRMEAIKETTVEAVTVSPVTKDTPTVTETLTVEVIDRELSREIATININSIWKSYSLITKPENNL